MRIGDLFKFFRCFRQRDLKPRFTESQSLEKKLKRQVVLPTPGSPWTK